MNTFNIIKSSNSQINQKSPIIKSIITSLIKTPLIFTRQIWKKAVIPRKQLRVRDNAYDRYMEIKNKTRRVLKFQELLLSQSPQIVPMSRLVFLAGRMGVGKTEAVPFVLKYPLIFEIYEHPVQRILYLRLTREALLQISDEKKAVYSQIDDCVIRLRKLLMLSNTRRLYLEHVRVSRREFGFPDDFVSSVVLKHPQYFRMFDGDNNNMYIELVEPKNEDRDGDGDGDGKGNGNGSGREKYRRLDVCAIERVRETEYRRRGVNEEAIRFAFIVRFPRGFKLTRSYKLAMWKWQRLAYWSPYEDISEYDMRSLEAKSRLEKRAVAMIHEILSLTVEKKMPLERIAHFRITMDLPKKPLEFVLQHQGIFYVSTKGNYGKLHTVFLREAYRRGELVEPNVVYNARKRLDSLISECRRMIRDEGDEREFASYSRREDGVGRNEKGYIDGNVSRRGNAVVKQDTDLEKDRDVGSDCTDADETVQKFSYLEKDSDVGSDCSDGDDDLSVDGDGTVEKDSDVEMDSDVDFSDDDDDRRLDEVKRQRN